jgi:hypothetical protein
MKRVHNSWNAQRSNYIWCQTIWNLLSDILQRN